MGISEVIADNKEKILALVAKYSASNVRVFGSFANSTTDADSNIDFLVDMEKGRSIFDMGGLLMDLQELFGRKVDVVTEKGLHKRIREEVLNQAVLL